MQRLRRNLRKVIEAHGTAVRSRNFELESLSYKHLFNIENGIATISVAKLEEVADEIGADFLDFFRE
jgi:hypothetical protein